MLSKEQEYALYSFLPHPPPDLKTRVREVWVKNYSPPPIDIC